MNTSITPTHRPETDAAHCAAVERVIQNMTANAFSSWDKNITLEQFSSMGCYSQSHFIEVFKEITGISPCLFLASLRIQFAKKQLLESRSSVTDICLQTGYSSLGTFVRVFHALVGVTPIKFRTIAATYSYEQLVQDALEFSRANRPGNEKVIEGFVSENSIPQRSGIIFIGTFRRGIPQGYPLSGTIVLGPGRFRIRSPISNHFYILAIRLPFDALPFAPENAKENIIVARTPGYPNINNITLDLRPLSLFDPPIVVALPRLLKIDPELGVTWFNGSGQSS